MPTSSPLAPILAARTADSASELVERLPDGRLRCYACGHRCPIPEGRAGVCKVRYNEGGTLRVPWGYVGALQCDPIEKKPFFHALPGTDAFSFGMLGCDLHCGYCQNWFTSQSIRDPRAIAPPRDVTPEILVDLAEEQGAPTVVSTYNEPLITSEWAVEIFREAKRRNLRTAYVSNGNGTPQVLDYIRPWIDFYKVDLKSMDDRHYRELGGVLQNVLDSIRAIYEREIWLEVLTLVIPDFNDSEAELREAARFIASVSVDVPWHVTAFHPDYKMNDRGSTPARTLIRAAEIGAEEGLRYVYAGNIPGRVGEWENTRCPNCRRTLIERHGFVVLSNRVESGRCPRCGAGIPGRWDSSLEGKTRTHGIPLPVLQGS
ncbi:MAG: AmmeMemoRadiSam system radical SAM enzyme [Acidobacteria bacterium]|nr:AmmeMemoRadiSam system radical SAM enzyme [Acidobacteriota bacterium]MCA1610918.1 AmmeMemoRadiSam system radical SAM enzyme [Acidobacteriota bacterium]MCA1617347.1 AmmeMemoRadiSam system radical SAM enzyme [Acidobacteriota bacterium]